MTEMPPPGPPPGAPQGPPPPPPQPMGWLRLTLQGSAFTSSIVTPAVTINGWRVPASYGENVIPVHAGPNRVEVSCQWLTTFGQAALDTQVPQGGQVSVYYAVPWHQFSRGAIGYEKQRRPGFAVFAVLLGVVLVTSLAFIVVPLVLG